MCKPGYSVSDKAISKMLVRSFVDEPAIGRLTTGQKIEVTKDAVPGRIWNGTVSTVPSTVKLRGARNVGEVTSTVDNHDCRLLPNVNVGVTIITAEHSDVLTLPREAVRMDDTKPYVYQVVDGELNTPRCRGFPQNPDASGNYPLDFRSMPRSLSPRPNTKPARPDGAQHVREGGSE